jgi:uncharacterized protein YjiS (DUF1127 family)
MRLIARTVSERRRRARETEGLAVLTSRELHDIRLTEYEAHVLRTSHVRSVAREDIDAVIARAHLARSDAIDAMLSQILNCVLSMFLKKHSAASYGRPGCKPVRAPRS